LGQQWSRVPNDNGATGAGAEFLDFISRSHSYAHGCFVAVAEPVSDTTGDFYPASSSGNE
jgi:hypothetical protein